MMKKALFIAFILFAMSAGVFFGRNFKKDTAALPVSQNSTATQSTPTPTPVVISTPKRLTIPVLNVDTEIESVGLDEERRMDVPKNVYNTAWYNLGPKPGEKGNAVIDGHFDTQTGAPSVFYYLKNLQVGDEIQVKDENGMMYNFEVTMVTSYPIDTFPIQKIFGPTDKTRLNLITCGGTWDREKKNYSDRVVVYSDLKNYQ